MLLDDTNPPSSTAGGAMVDLLTTFGVDGLVVQAIRAGASRFGQGSPGGPAMQARLPPKMRR